MVTRHTLRHEIEGEQFAATREFLERFGVDVDRNPEADVLQAVRNNGWEPTIEREDDPPGWKAEIREWRTPSQSRVAIARDRDRVAALVRALGFALAWPTVDEEMSAFDEQTRTLMGLSASEFLQQWKEKQLSTDDPRVVHLLIVRPLGR